MKRSRFTATQIISILKEADGPLYEVHAFSFVFFR